MNIPSATDAKAATVQARAQKQLAELAQQITSIERGIKERIADGESIFSQQGTLKEGLRDLLSDKGYEWHQYNEYREDSFFTVQWDTPNLRTA